MTTVYARARRMTEITLDNKLRPEAVWYKLSIYTIDMMEPNGVSLQPPL